MTNERDTPVRRPETVGDARYGVVQSRRLLIDTLRVVDAFADAVTVIGAHAVHVWVQAAWGPVEMQATRDADIAVNPVFVAPDPKLMGLMSELGVVPALPDRPGVYGYQAEAGLSLAERVTIDLIVPEVYAGPGRRAARIDGQPSAASRARGVELAVWDRRRVLLAAMDDPADSTEAWVAGPAALLVAKAHKVHERFSQVNIRADRLRPKDSGDVALLMLVSDPAEVARVMAEHSVAHPEIAPTVSEGATWLVEMYTDPSGLLRRHAVDALAARLDESEVNDAVDHWLDGFQVERANLSQMGVT